MHMHVNVVEAVRRRYLSGELGGGDPVLFRKLHIRPVAVTYISLLLSTSLHRLSCVSLFFAFASSLM